MIAKTTLDRIIGKGGLKSGSSRADSGLEKAEREGAVRRKSMEEAATGKGKMTDAERSGLLQVSRALFNTLTLYPTDTALGLGSRNLSSQNF